MSQYRVTWTFKMSRIVDANSADEAIEIAEDLGDINADYTATPKKAKRIAEERTQAV